MPQIKTSVTLPSQPVSNTTLLSSGTPVIGGNTGNGNEKRRKIEIVNRRTASAVTASTSTGSNIAIVNSGPQTIQSQNTAKTRQRLLTTSTNAAVTTQIVVEDASVKSLLKFLRERSVQ